MLLFSPTFSVINWTAMVKLTAFLRAGSRRLASYQILQRWFLTPTIQPLLILESLFEGRKCTSALMTSPLIFLPRVYRPTRTRRLIHATARIVVENSFTPYRFTAIYG